MSLLSERVAIISGIGPGMGRDAALACAREGANVVLAARTPEKVDAVAKEVEALGVRALRFPADVTDLEDISQLVNAAVDMNTPEAEPELCSIPLVLARPIS